MTIPSTESATRPAHPALKVCAAALVVLLSSFWALEPAFSDPPAWAPAHGWRAKQKYKYNDKKRYHEPVYAAPYDIDVGRCNRDVLGAVLGGATGAALGSTVGKGDGRSAAIIGGTIIGIIVGGNIGRYMDDVDQNCVGQVLEHAEDGQAIRWNDPNDGRRYQVMPTRTIETDTGRYCREYTTTSVVGGKVQEVYGRACRQPDGSWQLVS
jgi:surface antigen